MFRIQSLLAAAAVAFALPAFAHDGVMVDDAYAISASASATSGAAFMVIENHSDEPDRLIGVETPAADLAQLHTHIMDANGVAKMVEVPEGWEIPPGGTLELKRGGNHVMLMGLKAPLVDGKTIPLTLIFKHAGKVEVDVPVDQNHKPGDGAMGMSGMDHMKMGN